MVSQETIYHTSTPPVHSDRGFVAETETFQEVPAAFKYGAAPPRFWSGVIAGTLVAMSIFVLSYFLMAGCRVGFHQGIFAMSWGVAWWYIVTSCIAYFFGGWISTSIDSRPVAGWMHGATLWGLSIPLACVLGAFSAGATAVAVTSGSPATYNNFFGYAGSSANGGYGWMMFCILVVGLIFAIFGAVSGVNTLQSPTRPVVAH